MKEDALCVVNLWLVVESVEEKGEEKEKNPSAAGVETRAVDGLYTTITLFPLQDAVILAKNSP